MNKKLIALAVSGALTVPMVAQAQDDGSGPTLYGRLNLALGFNDDDANPNSTSDVTDVVSRFGIRGEEDLGNGLAAVYRYEFRVNADKGNLSSAADGRTQRLSYTGLKGGFGQVIIGSIWSTFYNTVGTYLDPSYTLGYFGYSSFMKGDYRIDSAIQYSGNFGPVGVSADIQLDSSNPAEDNVDRWAIGGKYDVGPVNLAIAYDSEQTRDDTNGDELVDDNDADGEAKDRLGVVANYGAEDWNVALGYQTLQQDGVGGAADAFDREMWTIVGGFNVSEGNRIYLQYWAGEDKTGPDLDKDGFVAGFYHNVSDRTRLYFEGTLVDSDATENDINRYLFGIRHDF